jgi:hypothetical protein
MGGLVGWLVVTSLTLASAEETSPPISVPPPPIDQLVAPGAPQPAKPLPNSVPTTASVVPAPTQERSTASVVEGGYDFSKVPNVRPQSPTFNPYLASGPGYFTFLDWLNDNYRASPPKYGYSRLTNQSQPFFAADFRYLDNPDNQDHVWSDALKRIRVGDDWMFSTGGQAWTRYMNIANQDLGSKSNVVDLSRVRVYGDLWYRDQFRLYAEFISAYSLWQDLPAGPNDVNKADFLDLFVDVKLFEWNNKPAYMRLGRQELEFGSQRLVSNIDFTNAKRTFQGARFTYKGEEWDFDAWWVKPVIINPNRLDSWDDKQNFVGAFSTYHPNKTDLLDLYYLYLDNRNTKQPGIVQGPYDIHTFGSRYTGIADSVLWDFEGAMQLGQTGGMDTVAGFTTAGLGYNFKERNWTPTIWAYYDYASGDHSPKQGTHTTFNQLFPFGHNYFGGLDLIGRQNIHDLNFHLFLYPTNWVTLWTQYHEVWLDSKTDALYNFVGKPIRRDPTGRAGSYVGRELNFIANFHLTPNQDLQVGYGHLFGGSFLKATGSDSVDYTYITYNLKW